MRDKEIERGEETEKVQKGKWEEEGKYEMVLAEGAKREIGKRREREGRR